MNQPKICVIGAGCSGITAVKNLVEKGLKNVVCFEQNDQVGGNWIYSATPSHSSVCETTHIISSKKLSEYVDFPMPDDYPDYPSHAQVLAYFQSYCDHFNLYPYIKFNTRVQKVEYNEDNRWNVFVNDERHEFDYVLIANGHHNTPRHPEFRDDFTGEYLHSHDYKNNRGFEGKKVLVVGAGNSGCDCAVEISRVAKHVAISLRSPQYIVPKFFLGKPTDTFNEGMLFLPKFIADPLRKLSLRVQVGRYTDYGLPEPDFPVIASHPTVNSELLYKIRHGKVHPKQGIDRIEGQQVYFKNGESETYDTIVAATGYKITTPFFDSEFLDYSDSDTVPLWLRMFHPRYQSLIFIGLVQPQGAVWPLSDLQSQLAAKYIAGEFAMPDNLEALAQQDAAFIEKEFIAAKRHTIEVHYHHYKNELLKKIG